MIFEKNKTEEERRAEYLRRYEMSKKKELEEGSEGSIYKQSLENIKKKKKRRRLIRNIKQILVYAAVLAVLLLIIIGLVLAVRQLFGGDEKTDVEITPTISPISGTDEITKLPTLTPVPTSSIELPKVSPLPTIAPDADYRGVVVIDPGHGGIDGGTSVNNIAEKDLNLQISMKLKDCLEQYGYSVKMTREDDTFVERIDRATFANNLGNCLAFISVHCNAFEDDTSINGVEVWCYDRSGSVEMSESILEQVTESTGAANRGIGFRTNHTVTRRTTMPACIVECGYLTSDKEHELLQNDEYQQRIVDGIVVGLDLFLQEWK